MVLVLDLGWRRVAALLWHLGGALRLSGVVLVVVELVMESHLVSGWRGRQHFRDVPNLCGSLRG